MLNRLIMIIIVMFVITSICNTANAESFAKLPFGLEWGQSKDEVAQKLSAINRPLGKTDTTLYYVIIGNGYETSTHFVFDKGNKLYQIFMLKICSDLIQASNTFNTMYNLLKSSYKLIYSKKDLSYVFYDVITNSYILLNGFMEHGKYVVIVSYEFAETSSLKKHDKAKNI